jgi:hypothetical protein
MQRCGHTSFRRPCSTCARAKPSGRARRTVPCPAGLPSGNRNGIVQNDSRFTIQPKTRRLERGGRDSNPPEEPGKRPRARSRPIRARSSTASPIASSDRERDASARECIRLPRRRHARPRARCSDGELRPPSNGNAGPHTPRERRFAAVNKSRQSIRGRTPCATARFVTSESAWRSRGACPRQVTSASPRKGRP